MKEGPESEAKGWDLGGGKRGRRSHWGKILSMANWEPGWCMQEKM